MGYAYAVPEEVGKLDLFFKTIAILGNKKYAFKISNEKDLFVYGHPTKSLLGFLLHSRKGEIPQGVVPFSNEASYGDVLREENKSKSKKF